MSKIVISTEAVVAFAVLLNQPKPIGCPIHRAFCDGWECITFPSALGVAVASAVAFAFTCHPSPQAENLLLPLSSLLGLA
jgi:hypothetical protein